MNYRKFRKNLKAISPIISVLLMIAIAVVASLVVYAWVMGYIGYQTGKTGDSVVIQSVSWTNDTNGAGSYPKAIYLQNVGSTSVTVVPASCLYINGLQDPTATTSQAGALISGSTLTISPAGLANYAQGSTLTIKVTTVGGTYSQVNEQVP
ncbi:MAG: archaellin/type IV pilin N-terminal domain-containing protein [Candidatus Bathyarchaeia archaeon]|jgi:flagellin-like protein